jgi:tetratricopeptide (TPR) repeat protein
VKRLAILAVLLAARAAAADAVRPPETWILDAPTANTLATQLQALSHFGGVKSIVTTVAFRAPAGGGALYVTRVTGNATAAERDKAASIELNELHDALNRQGAGARADSWTPKANAETKQLEAAMTWVDPAAGIANTGRIVIAADAQSIAAVSGECILATTADPALMATCKAALDTLDPGIAAASRVSLALVDVPAEPPIKAPEAPRLGEGSGRVTMQPISVPPPENQTDRRPIYVGGGLVVLALAFWWNRRKREQFEREDRREPAVKRGEHETDDDDLHAAAEEPAPPAKPVPPTVAPDDDDGETIATLTAKLEQDPSQLALYEQLGPLLQASKRWVELCKLLPMQAEHTEATPAKIALYHRAAKLVTDRLGNHAEAIKLYERIRELDTSDPLATRELIALYEKRRDWDKLIALHGELIDAAPEPELTAKLLAQLVTTRTKQSELAIATWQRVLDREPAHAEAAAELAKLRGTKETKKS